MKERTLSIQPPFGGTLLLTMLILISLLACGEMLTRTRLFKSYFIAASRGSPHFQFELQLGRLESIIAQEGPIDCIFLGNSMVWLGFDPLVFSQAFQEKTGKELSCYNFGVDGLPVSGASAIKQYLIQKYQPKLLIYGTDARDFAVPREDRDATVILDIPWMQYHLGKFTLQGWLYENSHIYRYLETFGYLLRMEKQYLFIKNPGQYTSEDFGFRVDSRISDIVSTSPVQHLDLGPVRYYYQLLSDYKMLPENMSSLEEILNINHELTSLLVVVMPVPETYMDFFSTKPQNYQLFIEQVRDTSEKYGSSFWLPPDNIIPQDGWADYTHLNTRGAAAFSAWLGGQVGEAVNEGSVFALSR